MLRAVGRRGWTALVLGFWLAACGGGDRPPGAIEGVVFADLRGWAAFVSRFA